MNIIFTRYLSYAYAAAPAGGFRKGGATFVFGATYIYCKLSRVVFSKLKPRIL